MYEVFLFSLLVSVSQALLDDGSEGGEQRELGVSEMASKDSEDLFKV